jgi:hypothetical protein
MGGDTGRGQPEARAIVGDVSSEGRSSPLSTSGPIGNSDSGQERSVSLHVQCSVWVSQSFTSDNWNQGVILTERKGSTLLRHTRPYLAIRLPACRHPSRSSQRSKARRRATVTIAYEIGALPKHFTRIHKGIVTSRATPSRDISNCALCWGAAAFTAAVRSAKELTCVPSTESNTSPFTIPAFAAVPPATTVVTIRPRSESILSAVADPGATGTNPAPMREPSCATRGGGAGARAGGLTIGALTGFSGALLQPQSARRHIAPGKSLRI